MDQTRLIAVLTAALTGMPAFAAPFAPAEESVKTFVAVPDADKVGIPAYPGARIFSSMGPVSPDAENHTLVLFSSDPKEKVIEFYKEQLKDWTVQTLERSGDPLIHEGQGQINLFGEEGMSTRHVLIGNGIEPMGRTKITIGYHEVEQPEPRPEESGQSGGDTDDTQTD